MTPPTLVLVPCFSGAPWDLNQFPALSNYPMRTLRLPEEFDSVEAYADALAEEIADLDRYVLVGDSFGASIALALATRRPPGLAGMVLSGGFAANPVTSPGWKAAMRASARMRGVIYRQMVLRIHAHRLASPHDRDAQMQWTKARSRQLFLEHTPATSFGARVRAALDADYTDQLGRVAAPTLILTPSHDELIGDDAARVLRDGIPNAREVVLDNTGHMFRFSHPDAYGRAVQEFLDDTLAATVQ